MTANNAGDRLIKAIGRKNNPSAVGLNHGGLPANAGSIKTLQDAEIYPRL